MNKRQRNRLKANLSWYVMVLGGLVVLVLVFGKPVREVVVPYTFGAIVGSFAQNLGLRLLGLIKD